MYLLTPAYQGDHASCAGTAFILFARFGSLNAVLNASRLCLTAIPCLNDVALQLIQSAGAIMKIAAREQLRTRRCIGSWTDLEDYLTFTLRGQSHERVIGLFLDTKNGLIADEVLGEGTVDHVPLYPRKGVERALQHGAQNVILVHNHPSGDPTPSSGDLATTKQVAQALATMEIALHDHVIVGATRNISMRGLNAW